MSAPENNTILIEKTCPRCNTWGKVQPDGTPFAPPDGAVPFVEPTPNIPCPACRGAWNFSILLNLDDLKNIHYEDGGEAFDMEEDINREFLRQLRANGYQWD